MKKNQVTNLHVNKTKIHTHIILLNWIKDKETKSISPSFPNKDYSFFGQKRIIVHVYMIIDYWPVDMLREAHLTSIW
jgi:hypothetical protein